MSPFSWQCQNLCLLSLAFITDWRVVSVIPCESPFFQVLQAKTMSNFQYIGLLLVKKSGGLCGCANPSGQRHFLQVLHVRKMSSATPTIEVKPPDFDYHLIRSLKPFPLWLQQGKIPCNGNHQKKIILRRGFFRI